ncbi:TIGR04086 family membrane protein [Intestinibacillus sp. Marseille-P6563]|uniref:TIGR04086 family membrane protein n=1 Tax=Intestinibacillus sp. Marseille-P6563 TaxID=2364792 RepID=UPI000F048382|nr:TIGR04086 family membrane protein [Intestinibacillus sp. Marseille-P6563]
MKKVENAPIGQILGFPVLFGLGATLILMAVGSFAVLSGKAEAGQVPMLTLVCLAIGDLCASMLAARRAARSRLLWGMAAGLVLFACLVVLSLVWLGQAISVPRVGINFAVTAVSSLCGGMLGASMKRKKHRKS